LKTLTSVPGASPVASLMPGFVIFGLGATPSGALSRGTSPGDAFLDGYHAGLYVTIGLTLVGAVISFIALRGVQTPAPTPAPVPVPVPATDQPEMELAGAAQH
jgi:hypothetical protein